MANNKIEVIFLEKRFKRLEKPLKAAASAVLIHLNQKNRGLEVFLLGSNRMNKNVLAFPAPAGPFRPDFRGKKPLGEIYLNPEYIEKRGEDLIFMLVHGVLHLLGYDHGEKGDTIIMQKKEKELMKFYAELHHRLRHRNS